MDGIPRSWYGLLMLELGDDLDAALDTLLEPIGAAITSSSERIKAFRARYGDDAPELAGEIEDLLGIAFVASQTYVNTVVSRLLKLHELVRRGSGTQLITTSGLRRDIIRYGFQPSQRILYSQIEVINAFANYFKHRDEWAYDWAGLGRNQGETAAIIIASGAYQSSTENLRTGAKYLGNTEFSQTSVFFQIFSCWRKQLITDYESEVSGLRPQ